MYFPFDTSFLLLIPVLIFAIYAQFKVKATFNKYSKIKTSSGLTGQQLSEQILQDNSIDYIQIEQVEGKLSDHFDPKKKKLGLSRGVYNGNSISSLGVAAHEIGHVLQYKENFFAVHIRESIYPLANFGSTLALPLFFIGLFFLRSQFLMTLGIILYIAAVVFTLVTLPLEFDASKRAIVLLRKGNYLTTDELEGAKKVLTAAALTYVAAAAMAVMQLIRLLLLRNRS